AQKQQQAAGSSAEKMCGSSAEENMWDLGLPDSLRFLTSASPELGMVQARQWGARRRKIYACSEARRSCTDAMEARILRRSSAIL
ncbi:hypothetical protein Droror1_Dr00027816, partial [Drosera rotundifolia]